MAAASALLTACGDDVRNDYVAPPPRPAPSVAEMKAALLDTAEEQCPGGEVETNDVELQGASFVGTSNVSVAERGEWTGFTCRLEGAESRPDGPAQVTRALALLHRDGLAVRVDSAEPEVTANFLDEYFVRLGA
ncbi:hypothetical protein [Nocardioides daphniae]|uniref:Uncharacterized protein n=1 Tax=Nocardioides daphniae TaxID=402297 RepID=A0A4P7UDX4_9ACTN|nr:hypothetical protein [Nocardioides daphniae]QCC78492.1 hypothetical protein E2C04_17120 [Nocardioides daphniae]GGD11982.1 hypothetical protein GCM10007231_08580 [Nocardioides daphniae]